MPKRSSSPSPDENVSAYEAVRRLTGNKPKAKSPKNPAAVALGRLGGKKGGKARAAKLSAEERTEIARRAAESRWSRRSEEGA